MDAHSKSRDSSKAKALEVFNNGISTEGGSAEIKELYHHSGDLEEALERRVKNLKFTKKRIAGVSEDSKLKEPQKDEAIN